MRRFIESMDEPTTISHPDGGGVIDLRDPQPSKYHDLKPATPLVWLVVIAVAVCIVVLVVRRFIN